MKPSRFRKMQDAVMFRALNVLEKFQNGHYELQYSPTFIVAPPRAGTTVTRQLVSWAIPTSYFSNLTATSSYHLGKPLPIMTAKLVSRWGSNEAVGSFESNFGRTAGRSAPAEGETVWAYWFRSRYEAVEPEDLSPRQRQEMYRAVAATERIFDAPFFNKTTVLSLRIRAIASVFPRALFIHIVRDPLDTAQSIFRARTTRYPHWLGPRPPECEDIGHKPVLEQVCDQVYYVEKNIAYERSMLGNGRFLTVHYKDVCEQPRREIERIAEFMNSNGAPAQVTRQVPDSFPFSHGRKIDEADYKAMRSYLEKLYR